VAEGCNWRDVRGIHCSAGVLYHQPNTVVVFFLLEF